MMKITLMFVLFFSAGCAVTPRVVKLYDDVAWTVPAGKTDADFDREDATCQRDGHAALNAQGYYFACMKAIGYSLTRKGS